MIWCILLGTVVNVIKLSCILCLNWDFKFYIWKSKINKNSWRARSRNPFLLTSFYYLVFLLFILPTGFNPISCLCVHVHIHCGNLCSVMCKQAAPKEVLKQTCVGCSWLSNQHQHRSWPWHSVQWWKQPRGWQLRHRAAGLRCPPPPSASWHCPGPVGDKNQKCTPHLQRQFFVQIM